MSAIHDAELRPQSIVEPYKDISVERAAEFFAFARERQNIYRKRMRGELPPWTDDPVLQGTYLTNVFREQDKTTVWFRENVRDPLAEHPLQVFAATILFRWFNRIETGELLFKKTDLFNQWLDELETGESPHEVGDWLAHEIEERMERPFFTGAFMIKPDDSSLKHYSVSRAASDVIAGYIHKMRDMNTPIFFDQLQNWCRWLMEFHGLGGFMAYEAVSDFRWTCLARDATDIMTWANPGPGCKRGLSRIYYDHPKKAGDFNAQKAINAMKWLLGESQKKIYWPPEERPWEMREVEHWLCEFDKIERVRKGGGRIKRKYSPPTDPSEFQMRRL